MLHFQFSKIDFRNFWSIEAVCCPESWLSDQINRLFVKICLNPRFEVWSVNLPIFPVFMTGKLVASGFVGLIDNVNLGEHDTKAAHVCMDEDN